MLVRLCITLLALILLPVGSAVAATSGYFQDWNDAGSDNWIGVVGTNTTSWQASGGNDGGYLRTTQDPAEDAFDTGARAIASLPDLIGDYTDAYWAMTFDIILEEGQLDASMMRLRGVSPLAGWVRDLSTLPALGAWTSVVVTIDGDWTEAEARANGWVPDAEHPLLAFDQTASLSWEETVANVRALSVRLSGESEILTSGIDNFRLESITRPVPEPSTAVLFGLGLIGLARGRRSER